MEAEKLVRVVRLTGGKLRPVEFRLRPGEVGLSVFACKEAARIEDIVEAVRSLGKRGTLAAACISPHVIRELGLKLIRTPGGTLRADINDMHFEIRLTIWQRLWVSLKRKRHSDYFNEVVAPQRYATARVIEDS